MLVDNSPHAYGFQVDNGIPIESWFDDTADTELLKLAAFLKHVHRVDDVRELVREHFRTFELLENVRREQEQQEEQAQQQYQIQLQAQQQQQQAAQSVTQQGRREARHAQQPQPEPLLQQAY